MKRQPTEAQRAAAHARREAMRKLAKRVSDMPEADRLALALRIGLRTIEGHELSPFNACMVYMQCPTATMVGGYRQWLRAGRVVSKGQHGLSIWVPIGKPKVESSEPAESNEGEKPGFVLGIVFDIGQTVEQGADVESEALAVA